MNETKRLAGQSIMNKHTLGDNAIRAFRHVVVIALAVAAGSAAESIHAATLYVPNGSFESPAVPATPPYASPALDAWQKSPQPAWYDPSQNADTPWEYLMGAFYNVPFPGQFIDNCDGGQAAFLFALPEAAVFQDYDSLSGTNTVPTHGFDARFEVGRSYTLSVAVLGGGGGMKPGVTLELRLYYRDASSQKVTVAATTITNSSVLFPTNTHLVDFQVRVPAVKGTDSWAGKHIGVELASTVGFELAGGYWDLDNVRLVESIEVPNGSFESPAVPATPPYASPALDAWQKSPQPAWYDPSQNADTPWDYLMGAFYNVPFPGQFIDNCDGSQAAFLFALPEAGLFQDHNSVSGTNTVPTRAFDVTFAPGKAYTLTAGVLGGGGGMKPGATLQMSLYYRDALSNAVTVAATSITNTSAHFPTNTHFVEYQVQVPGVKAGDPWAGKNIGIELLSTSSFELAGGYWDLDHVRLTETVAPDLSFAQATNGQLSFTLLSEPGLGFEIQTTTNLAGDAGSWTALQTITNVTGRGSVSLPISADGQRYFRARGL